MTYSMCCRRATSFDAVRDLGVARHRTHGRIGEGLHQLVDRRRFEDGVPVHHHDDVVAGVGDAVVEGGGLAAVGLPEDAHPGQSHGLDDVGGAVGGTVVHDDHLDRVRARHQGPHGRLDALPLVVRGHDHRHLAHHARAPGPVPGPALPVVPGGEDTHHGEPQRHEHRAQQQQPGEHGQQHRGDGDGGDQEAPFAHQVGRGRRVGSGQAQALGDGGEAVALGDELRDELVERLDGEAALAAAVVHQHDRALPVGGPRAPDDLVHARARPVPAVDVAEHRELAPAGDEPDGLELPVVRDDGPEEYGGRVR